MNGAVLAVPAVLAALLVPGAVSAPGASDPVPGDPVFHFTDQRIDESSGLVAAGGLVVTVNDSGDSNRIFTVDPATGDTVGVTSWQGDAVDIEALAPAGDGEVWVGDIGDNNGARDSVRVARVPFGRGERTVTAPTYDLVYPDGAHDAETLLADPGTGQLFLLAKEFRGRVYAAPEQLDPDRPNRLTEVGTALGLGTDGALLPDGRHVVLRNYTQAGVYTWPDLERVGTFDLPRQPQGEGLAVTGPDELLISSEGAGAEVLRVRLPDEIRAALRSASAEDGATSGADDPAEDPAATDEPGRGLWPWAVGGVVGIVLVVALLRALRPR